MTDAPDHMPTSRLTAAWRIACTAVLIVVVQGVVCGAAALPVVLVWVRVADVLPDRLVWRAALVSASLVPSYVAFALTLMLISAVACAAMRLRTPAGIDMRIAEMSWTLMRWAHYMVAIHLVRTLAGPLFRGSPIWTLYLRMSGARMGRRVYVNSLSVSDYNLLEFGSDVVIGADVHVSGHTVEAGVVKTGRVRLGDGVTIGLGTAIDIGVVIGARTQIGALSLVPKHTSVPADAVYAGIPVREITPGRR